MDNKWIFCHRGMWNSKRDQNKSIAVNLAASYGFSSEIDLRTDGSEVYVSHDPINPSKDLFFSNYDLGVSRFAINLKCDGLYEHLSESMQTLREKDSFVFDGSIPEMVKYKELGLPHALRLSEYEREIPWKVKYLWLDGFETDWWIKDQNIMKYLENMEVVIVSPELHGRSFEQTWEWLFNLRTQGYSNLSICTDKPLLLLEKFG